MTDPHLPHDDRLNELLADRALFGLSDEERAELDSLLQNRPGFDAEIFDRLAANLAIAGLPPGSEPLPPHLAYRIAEGFGERRKDPQAPRPLPRSGGRWLAAFVGLAAGLLLAVSYFTLAPKPSRPNPAERRAELLAKAQDPRSGVVHVEWTTTDDPAGRGASGDVVWDSATQEGYMRFKGLARNNPMNEQYQLWVFDANRDDRYPVDGGVFDIPEGVEEVIVPIQAKLPVARPTLFAVTVERPGGVVVSSRERLPLLAKVPVPSGG